jgi:hypothetical protein
MKILKTSDKVRVKIGDIALIISPLSQSKKIEFSGLTKVIKGVEMNDSAAQLTYLVKHCVKAIEGVIGHDDKPIELKMDVDGTLDEESVSDVCTILTECKDHITALIQVSHNKMITDIATGKKLKGVEVSVNPKT